MSVGMTMVFDMALKCRWICSFTNLPCIAKDYWQIQVLSQVAPKKVPDKKLFTWERVKTTIYDQRKSIRMIIFGFLKFWEIRRIYSMNLIIIVHIYLNLINIKPLQVFKIETHFSMKMYFIYRCSVWPDTEFCVFDQFICTRRVVPQCPIWF